MDKKYRVIQYIYDPALNIELNEGDLVTGYEVENKESDDFNYVDVLVGKDKILRLHKGIHLVESEVNNPISEKSLNDSSISDIQNKGTKIMSPIEFAKDSLFSKSLIGYVLFGIAGAGTGALCSVGFKNIKPTIFVVSGALLGSITFGVVAYQKYRKNTNV